MPELVVRNLSSSDIEAVVDVHLAAFEGFFLTLLGRRFLRAYYQSILDFNQLSFVAVADGNVVGFVTGIENGSGFYRHALIRRGFAFIFAAVPAALSNPRRVLPRLLSALGKRPSGGNAASRNAASLTSIAVAPSCAHKGVGHALMDAFKRDAIRRGLARIFLETDAAEGNSAVSFYRREGFTIYRTYTTAQGRVLHEFSIDL